MDPTELKYVRDRGTAAAAAAAAAVKGTFVVSWSMTPVSEKCVQTGNAGMMFCFS